MAPTDSVALAQFKLEPLSTPLCSLCCGFTASELDYGNGIRKGCLARRWIIVGLRALTLLNLLYRFESFDEPSHRQAESTPRLGAREYDAAPSA